MTSIDIADLINAAMWSRFFVQTHAASWCLGGMALAYLAYLVIRDVRRSRYDRAVRANVERLIAD
jgi:hypothetical protein